MTLRISHVTRYEYSRPVFLEPHVVRLQPRSDPAQRVLDWNIEVRPEPMARSLALDADGNSVLYVWFSGLTDSLEVQAEGEVETLRVNPYDFLYLGDDAGRVPARYSPGAAAALQRFRAASTIEQGTVAEWTAAALEASSGHAMDFLNALNQRLYSEIRGVDRLEGAAYEPEKTLTAGEASCRDVAVAMIACCRQAGLAARFVSGYQVGDPDTKNRHLHAWAEIYLPGGGWRGYDPTHGMAVADGHVALASAPGAAETLPVAGSFRGSEASATMSAKLLLDLL